MTKGRKKRVKKVHPKNLLPLEMWVNLIFAPYLNLDQLAVVRRTCKTFCFHPRVEALFQEKIKKVFGTFEKINWNKYFKTSIEMPPLPTECCAFLYADSCDKKRCLRLCSTKERAVNVLDTDYHSMLMNERFTCSLFKQCKQSLEYVFFPWRRLYVYGLNDIITDRIGKIFQKDFAKISKSDSFIEFEQPQDDWEEDIVVGLFSKQRAVLELYNCRYGRVFYHTATTFDPTEQTIIKFFIEEV